VHFLRNSLFAEGLSSSLKAGFAASPPEAGAVIVLLGDMPFITAHLIDELVSAWQSTGRPAALIPISDGRRGNPVVLSRMLEDAVRGLSGDAGAGRILRDHPEVVEWPVKSQAILQDVDTQDALRRLQA
jgi:molybdenum cofactor cytidylyltransferase